MPRIHTSTKFQKGHVRIARPKTLLIKIHGFPPKAAPIYNFHKYVSFTVGTLLAISEVLPFFKSIEGDGIISALSKILSDYNTDFK